MTINIRALYPGLEAEVDVYLSKAVHKGYVRPFGGLTRFDTSEVTPGILQVIPRGLNEEDLSDVDPDFNLGLANIGIKYNLRLNLPYWAYEK
jgi:hypothetical protein